MTWRVILGTLSIVLTTILFGYVTITEQDRMADFTASYQARQIETGGALFENNCKNCHGLDGKGIEGVAPALNAADLLVAPPGEAQPPRLKEIGWAGSTPDYIRATISGGRPRASAAFSNYPNRMPTWSQEFGGPLRPDQINSLVAFIMNWAPAYANSAVEPTPAVVGVGTDITTALPTGDPTNGKAITEAKGCVGCHLSSAVGPAWLASADPAGEGIGTRAGHRFKDDGYTGKATSAEQYLFESIVQPNAYVVPPFQPGIMPATFGGSLSKQDVADVIAYLLTVK